MNYRIIIEHILIIMVYLIIYYFYDSFTLDAIILANNNIE